MKRLVLLIVVLALAALPCFAAEQKSVPTVVPVAKDGVQRVEILAGDYFFRPAHIVVKANVPVEFIIKKEPYMVPHDIVLKAPEAGIDIREDLAAEARTIRFTPKKAGKYPFYCDKKLLFFKSHRDQGMHGILEVVD